MKLPAPVLIAAMLTQAGCSEVCSDFCQALPSAEPYHVCSATGSTHFQRYDRLIIKPSRNGHVMNVTFEYKNPEKKADVVQMFPGQKGLVGFHDFENADQKQWTPRHLVSIVRTREPMRDTKCTTDDVIRIDVLWLQEDGEYREITSDTDGAHAHGQLESIPLPGGS